MAEPRSSGLREAASISAIVLAVYAQWIVHRNPYGFWGWLLFVVAALSMAVAAGRPEPVAAPTAVEPLRPSGTAGRIGFGFLAVLACAGATYGAAAGWHPVLPLVSWGASLILASLAVRGWTAAPPARVRQPWSALEIAAVATLLVIAALARTLWLDSLPRAYFGDEPRVAAFLYREYRGGRIPNFFTMGWNTWPVVGLSLQGIFVPWLGLHMTTLRLSAALFGTLGVLVTYLLARELGSWRLALPAAVLFAVCRTAIDFSRLGIAHSQILFFEPLALYLWWRGVNGGRALSYLWAGIATGWCMYSYNAGQLVPPLLFAWMGLAAVFAPRRVASYWRAAALTFAGFVLTLFPYAFYFTDRFTFGSNWYQWSFMARDRQVLSQIIETWRASGFDAAASMLWRQVQTTWLGFQVLPGGGYVLGYRGGGMLDDVSAPLFVLGLAMTVRRLPGGREAFVLYWWFVTFVVGGIMTSAPPSFVRMVGLLPAVSILAAQPLELIARIAPDRIARVGGGLLVAAFLGAAAWENWRTYFVEYPARPADPVSEVARYLKRQPADHRAALLGSEHWLNFDHEIFQIEFPGRLRDIPDPQHFLPIREPVDHPLILVFAPSQHSLADYALGLYPGASVDVIEADLRDPRGIRVVTISPEQARARAGLRVAMHGSDGAGTPGGVADPFATELPAAGARERIVWSGRLYWAPLESATLTFEATSGAVLRLGDLEPLASRGEPISRTVELARGWHPIRIEEPLPRTRPIVLSVTERDAKRAFTRWDLDPHPEAQGLTARYETKERTVKAIDPQLDLFAVESLFRSGNEPMVRMPFTVSWRGALRVEHAGTYEFEAIGSGPYTVRLDGAEILHGAPRIPEEPHVGQTSVELAPGLHPIVVEFDSTVPAHTTRRMFQLYWTPPGQGKHLVPASNFAPVEGSHRRQSRKR